MKKKKKETRLDCLVDLKQLEQSQQHDDNTARCRSCGRVKAKDEVVLTERLTEATAVVLTLFMMRSNNQQRIVNTFAG